MFGIHPIIENKKLEPFSAGLKLQVRLDGNIKAEILIAFNVCSAMVGAGLLS